MHSTGKVLMNSKRQRCELSLPYRQSGMATLLLVLVVMVGLTAITFYAANSGLLKQRISANEVRAKEALQSAEIGTNMAINYVKANRDLMVSTASGGWMQSGSERWASCGSNTSLPCGDGTTNHFNATEGGSAGYIYYLGGSTTTLPISDPLSNYSSPATGDTPFQVYMVAKCVDSNEDNDCDTGEPPSLGDDSFFVAIAEGWSADQTGKAVTQQGFKITKALSKAPDAPLVAIGNAPLTGSLEIVTNPNGGGENVPLTAWTGGNVTINSNSVVTCYPGEYLDSVDATGSGSTTIDPLGTGIELCDSSGGSACKCSAASETGKITYDMTEGVDVVDNVSPFPDLFEYLFGVDRTEWTEVKDKADQVIDNDNCGSLDASSSGLIWVESDNPQASDVCDLNGGTVGSTTDPVLLVVEDMQVHIRAGAQFFGVVFVFDKDGDFDANEAEFNGHGNAQVYGAVITEGVMNTGGSGGTFIIRYEATVLGNLYNNGPGRGVGRLPGTWLDYY